MVYGPSRGQWFNKPLEGQDAAGRWPKTSAGLNWYEIPISSGFMQQKWDENAVAASFEMKRLIFGVAPDYYMANVGHAYKVMRETWRKWQYPQKDQVTHVQLRDGGSWHVSTRSMTPFGQDKEVHLTFGFFGKDAHGNLVKLNGTVHGYQQDAVDFDNEFRAQFAAHVAQKNAAKGKPRLPYVNRCGTLDWVPDPANFDSLDEGLGVIKEHINFLIAHGTVSAKTGYIRWKYPRPLPTYPGLPQPSVDPWVTVAPAGATTTQAAQVLPRSLPHAPFIARRREQQRFPQTSQIPPPAPGDASTDQGNKTGMGSATSAIVQASRLWGRWSPYNLDARAHAGQSMAVGMPKIHRPATMWGGRQLAVPVQASQA